MNIRRALAVLIFFALGTSASAASAQVAAEISVQSDLRSRGYSTSDEQPIAAVAINYDNVSGFYLGSSVLGVFQHGDPRLLGGSGSIGYATYIAPAVSLDIGLARTEYTAHWSGDRPAHYSEAYLGIASQRVFARIAYSPDYYADRISAVYAQLDGAQEIAPDLTLSAHLGALTYFESGRDSQFDWALAATQRLGRATVFVDMSGRLKSNPYDGYGRYRGDQTQALIGVSFAL